MSAMKPRSRSAPSKRGARRGGTRGRGGGRRSTLDILKKLLARPLPIRVGGETKRVSALEAILLQLTQNALAGNARACRALLTYQEFASKRVIKSVEFKYVESDYTRAFSNSTPRSDDDRL